MLSETFFESQASVLLAPFYADLLDRLPDTRLGPLSTHTFLSALQTDQFADSLPLKTLAMAQCLSAVPNQLSAKLDVRHTDSLRTHTTTVAFCKVDQSSDTEQVLLLEQDVFEPHSGFCDKTLNSLQVDFVLHVSSEDSPRRAPAASTSDRVDEHSPVWLLPDGSTNGPVLRSLCSKVLAVLSDKPGTDLTTLHTALIVLSVAHTRVLLRWMEDRGLLRTRRSLVPSAFCSDIFGFNAAVFSPRARSTAADTVLSDSYFPVNMICGQL